jgi:ABC-type multidrug transport system fused ATPase/permease subunit
LKRFTFFSTYKEVLKLLPKRLQKKFGWLIVLVFITSIVDLLGLAAFIPIISLIANPALLQHSSLLAAFQNLSGISNFNHFVIFLFSLAVVLMVLRLFFLLFSQRLQASFVFELARYVGTSTYAHFLSSSYESFSKKELAQVVRELSMSPQHFAKFLVMPLLLVSSEMVILILVVGSIAVYNLDVFLLLVITVFPAAALFQYLVKGRLRVYGEKEHVYAPKLYANSARGSFGFVDIKLRNKEKKLLNEYERVFAALNRISINTATLNIVPAKLFELITVVGLLIIAVYGFIIKNQPSLVLPLITIYAAAGYRIIPSLSRIVPSLMQLEQYQYLFKVYKPVFETVDRVDSWNSPVQPLSFEREIQLENIWFDFGKENSPILSNLNLTIPKGKIIGFVGKSGSGKTTLVNLIAGFYSPTKGNLKVDGVAIDPLNLPAWWKKISYVQQSSYIEKGTLASNIAFLDDTINEEKLNYAILAASLTELVEHTNPFDFAILEGGKNLSGGQRQRIIIARALYHNSELIILDEATSALDSETEEAINETIKNLRNTGITIVIIAHRYSTLKYTDQIWKMEKGASLSSVMYDQLISAGKK